MHTNNDGGQEEIYSKVLRAGRRTYFFDVRETRASDYYLTITESKKFTNEDGSFYYKKHKIYLYKEDFSDFAEILTHMMEFIVKERGKKLSANAIKKITMGSIITPPYNLLANSQMSILKTFNLQQEFFPFKASFWVLFLFLLKTKTL